MPSDHKGFICEACILGATQSNAMLVASSSAGPAFNGTAARRKGWLNSCNECISLSASCACRLHCDPLSVDHPRDSIVGRCAAVAPHVAAQNLSRGLYHSDLRVARAGTTREHSPHSQAPFMALHHLFRATFFVYISLCKSSALSFMSKSRFRRRLSVRFETKRGATLPWLTSSLTLAPRGDCGRAFRSATCRPVDVTRPVALELRRIKPQAQSKQNDAK